MLTVGKKLLSRYFSRLPRESLYTVQAMFRMGFAFMSTVPDKTLKTAVSA